MILIIQKRTDKKSLELPKYLVKCSANTHPIASSFTNTNDRFSRSIAVSSSSSLVGKFLGNDYRQAAEEGEDIDDLCAEEVRNGRLDAD